MKKLQKPEEEATPQVPKQPGYQSQWGTQINDIMGKIQNREPFEYDFNADALYNQYKDRYIQQGKLAMEDTMGQAAALTGGYGNSYAQSVSQQTYQGYMQGLNDKIPDLYQMALDRYTREGDAMFKEYGLLSDRDNADYGRWQDNAQLAQSQIQAMIEAGIKPSDDLLWQSGLSKEYIEAMLDESDGGIDDGGGGSSGGGSGGSKLHSMEEVVAFGQQMKNAGQSASDIKGMLNAAKKEGVITEAQEKVLSNRYT